jgi:hypothetical protein
LGGDHHPPLLAEDPQENTGQVGRALPTNEQRTGIRNIYVEHALARGKYAGGSYHDETSLLDHVFVVGDGERVGDFISAG